MEITGNPSDPWSSCSMTVGSLVAEKVIRRVESSVLAILCPGRREESLALEHASRSSREAR